MRVTKWGVIDYDLTWLASVYISKRHYAVGLASFNLLHKTNTHISYSI